MDRPNDSGATPPVSDEPASDVQDLLQSESWERRLEAARKQREQVLAQKGAGRRVFRAAAPGSGWPSADTPEDLSPTAPFPEPEEQPLLPRGAAQSLPVNPHLTLVRPPAGPLPANARAADREAEEEFEALDAFEPAPPPLPRLRPVPPTVVTPLRPARALEPASVAQEPIFVPQAAPTPAAAPTLRSGRVVTGFALGLGVGVGLGVAVWLLRPAEQSAPASVPVQIAAPLAPAAAPGPATAAPAALAPLVPTLGPESPAALARDDAALRLPLTVSAIVGRSVVPLPVASGPGVPPQLGPHLSFDAAEGPRALSQEASPTQADALPVFPPAAAPLQSGWLAALSQVRSGSEAPPGPMARALRPLAGPAPVQLNPGTSEPSITPALVPALLTGAADPGGLVLASAPVAGPDRPATMDVTPAQPLWPSHLVKLLVPQGTDAATVTEAQTLLSGSGFQTAEPARVDVSIKGSQVRYFHAEDRPLAEALAEDLGYRLRDFTGGGNAPPPGTVEVWFKGDGPAAVAAKPVSTKKKAPAKTAKQAPAPAPAAQAPDLAKQSAKIASKLRLGDFK